MVDNRTVTNTKTSFDADSNPDYVVATDEVSGANYQRVKLDIGGDGASVPVDGGQEVMAGSIPVTIASDQSAVPISDNGGSITVDGTVSVTEPVSIDDNGGSITIDGTVTVEQSTASSLNAQVIGNVSHDSADSGNPVKVGGVYNATDPSLDDGDRSDLQVNNKGYLHTSIRRSDLTTLVSAQTYNNVTTTTTSSSVDCRHFKDGTLFYDLARAGTPSTIELQLQGSPDDTDWFDIGDRFLQELLFDDGIIGAGGLVELVPVLHLPEYIRLVVTASGTTASNTFTLTAKFSMRS